MRASTLIAIVLLGLVACAAFAQDAPAPAAPIRVFIDCNNIPCDSDFFRTEIAFVDHVRERQTAGRRPYLMIPAEL